MPALVSSQYSPQFLHQLQSFRNEKYLCDCRLLVAIGSPEGPTTGDNHVSSVGDVVDLPADGSQTKINSKQATLEFPAHRLVLAASSQFFKNLFHLKRQESVTTVNLNNCSPECVEVILQFLYSGELQLGISDPQHVLRVAKIFQIKTLEQILSPLTETNNNIDCSPDSQPNMCTPAHTHKRRSDSVSKESSKKKKAGHLNVMKHLCSKHSLFSCSLCPSTTVASDAVDSDSAVSVPYELTVKTSSHKSQPPYNPSHSLAKSAFSSLKQGPQSIGTPTNGFSESECTQSVQNYRSPQSVVQQDEEQTASTRGLGYGARPGYYGPLLPTKPGNGGTEPFLNGGLHSTGIFPFHNGPTPFMLANGPNYPNFASSSPIITSAPSLDPMSPAALNDKQSAVFSPKSWTPPTGNLNDQGFASPRAAESASMVVVPSTDKEGWCRNKKYIEKVANGFRCAVCSKVYGRYNSVSYHVTIYHRNPPIKCDEPGCQFTTREARYIHFHKYYRHGTPLPKSIDLGSRSCPFCRHVAKSPAMLEKHVSRHMPDCLKSTNAGPKLYKCPQCPREVPGQKAMLDHVLTHTEDRSFQCDQCSYRGRTESNLRQHTMFKHSTETFTRRHTCDTCGYCCPTDANLRAHKRRAHKATDDGDSFDDDFEQTADSQRADSQMADSQRVDSQIADETNGHSEERPLNLSADPACPPPSSASTPDTDLDDSHARLLATGYQSLVNYGTL